MDQHNYILGQGCCLIMTISFHSKIAHRTCMLFAWPIKVSTVNNESVFTNLLHYRNSTRKLINFVHVVGSEATSGTLKGTQNIFNVLCHTVM